MLEMLHSTQLELIQPAFWKEKVDGFGKKGQYDVQYDGDCK